MEFNISVSLFSYGFLFHGWQGRKYYDVPNFPVPVDSLPIRNSILFCRKFDVGCLV